MDETFQAQMDKIEEADLVVGIPSFNSALTIGHVVRAVTAGLAQDFSNVKTVLVNSDAGSTDGTQEEVKRAQNERVEMILTSHSVHPVHQIVIPYHGVPGRENAFKTIFEATERLKAKACAVVDPGLKSTTPDWVKSLLKPVYEQGFDYVAPLYVRHRFDGTITNGIVYPLTRALYGKKVRQLIGGDFGFSGNLVRSYLTKNVWETDVVRFGMDIWMATVAISEGYRVCQTFLGPKIYDATGPGSDLGSMFTQVVSSVYSLMEEYQPLWEKVQSTEPIPTFGVPDGIRTETVQVNVERMIDIFRLAMRDLMEIWRKVMSPETLHSLESLARPSNGTFSLAQDLWVRVVYDFALAYHQGSVHRDHLLKSMIPLYLGWVASFVKENQEGSAEDVEARIEALCKVFEELKPYLIERWTERR